VVVDPVDAGLDEGEEIDEEEREDGAEAVGVGDFFAGDVELELSWRFGRRRFGRCACGFTPACGSAVASATLFVYLGLRPRL